MVYSCSMCGSQYSRMWSLNRHRKKCKALLEGKTAKEPPNRLSSGEDENEAGKLTESEDGKGTESEDGQLTNSEDGEVTGSEDGQLTDSEEESFTESEDDHTTDSDNNESMEEEEESSDNEDVTMDEEEKRETMIKWPVSRAYLINYPWSYWGEVPRIKTHINWLERLRDAEHPTVIYNIQNASSSQIGVLCEIAYNYLNFQIPAERSNWKEIRKHKRALRLLAKPDVDIEVKREEVLRRGANFVQLLFHVIDPLLLFDVPRKIHIEDSMSDDNEEVESEQEEEDYDVDSEGSG